MIVTCCYSMERNNAANARSKTRRKKTTTVEKKVHTLKELVISTSTKWIG